MLGATISTNFLSQTLVAANAGLTQMYCLAPDTSFQGPDSVAIDLADVRLQARLMETAPFHPLFRPTQEKLPLSQHVLSHEAIKLFTRLDETGTYRASLLRLALDAVLNHLNEATELSPATQINGWLDEFDRIGMLQLTQLRHFERQLNEDVRSGRLSDAVRERVLTAIHTGRRRLYRTAPILRTVLRWSLSSKREENAYRIRKAIGFILSLPEFQRDFDWQPFTESSSNVGVPKSLSQRRDVGLALLKLFHPGMNESDFQLYQRAAKGDIRNRVIAFDIDKTLADVYFRPLAKAALQKNPENYDSEWEDIVHQFSIVRLPYRGIQALLLGLWAAGNHLGLYTAAENRVENLEALLNDFPIIKVALGLLAPNDAFRRLSVEDLRSASNIRDALKTAKAFERLHGSPQSGSKLSKTSKIPYPAFDFDVLVDDESAYADVMEALGLGRRWILASQSAEEMLGALEDYFG